MSKKDDKKEQAKIKEQSERVKRQIQKTIKGTLHVFWIGRTFRDNRLKLDLSQGELAKKFNLLEEDISKWESKKAPIPLEYFKPLISFFKLSKEESSDLFLKLCITYKLNNIRVQSGKTIEEVASFLEVSKEKYEKFDSLKFYMGISLPRMVKLLDFLNSSKKNKAFFFNLNLRNSESYFDGLVGPKIKH